MNKKPQKEALSPPLKLHYVTDARPGLTRKKRGGHFHYFDARGKRITDKDIIKRINKLAIPPAYRRVWICPLDNGHLQATGIDSRGRKQYRYHPAWRAEREADKFEHILYFGEELPSIRRKIRRDMALPGLSRNKVMATVVELLEKTLIRVGNAEYARHNGSYGLTTLHNEHVEVRGADIRFRFAGKSGKQWNLSLHDRRIAAVIRKCEDIPGQELFKYVDENGRVADVTSSDVNAYLKDISGENFTAKDYRTWSATVLAALALKEFEKYDSQAQAKKNILRAIESVAKRLGNTPTICRKSYIHPEVINAYLDGDFIGMVEEEIDKEFRRRFAELSAEEIMVMALLYRRLAKTASRRKASSA